MLGFFSNSAVDDSDNKSRKNRIPFKTRKVQTYEGVYPQGFVRVPVYAHKDPEQDESGLEEAACPLVMESNLALIDLDSSYQ